MSIVDRDHAEPVPGSPEDPFRLGWRHPRRELPDGTVEYDEEPVPLTLEDLLFPEEYDHAMYRPAHAEDCRRLHAGLTILLADVPGAVVTEDCRVDFEVPGIRPMGPDLAVFFDVPDGWEAATLRVGQLGARPILVVEVTSPETREQDMERKRELYHRIGVPCYVIVDSRYRGDDHREDVRLIGLRHASGDYEPIPLDDRGRLRVDGVDLLLAVDGTQVACIHGATGRPIESAVGNYFGRQAAEARAEAAEARSRELEAGMAALLGEVRRLRGGD